MGAGNRRRSRRPGLRFPEAVAVVVADQAPARRKAVARLRVDAELALRVQALVLVEAELVQVRVLRHIERDLHARAAEKAARGTRVDVEAQSREDHGVVFVLARQDVALPAVEAEAAEQRAAARLRDAGDALPPL